MASSSEEDNDQMMTSGNLFGADSDSSDDTEVDTQAETQIIKPMVDSSDDEEENPLVIKNKAKKRAFVDSDSDSSDSDLHSRPKTPISISSSSDDDEPEKAPAYTQYEFIRNKRIYRIVEFLIFPFNM